MKKAENNNAAKIGYAVTMLVVTAAIVIVVKKYKQ